MQEDEKKLKKCVDFDLNICYIINALRKSEVLNDL